MPKPVKNDGPNLQKMGQDGGDKDEGKEVYQYIFKIGSNLGISE